MKQNEHNNQDIAKFLFTSATFREVYKSISKAYQENNNIKNSQLQYILDQITEIIDCIHCIFPDPRYRIPEKDLYTPEQFKAAGLPESIKTFSHQGIFKALDERFNMLRAELSIAYKDQNHDDFSLHIDTSWKKFMHELNEKFSPTATSTPISKKADNIILALTNAKKQFNKQEISLYKNNPKDILNSFSYKIGTHITNTIDSTISKYNPKLQGKKQPHKPKKKK